jgi:hypothetical protein
MQDNKGFNVSEYFSEESSGPSPAGAAIGGLGIWLLHLVKLLFVLYTAGHSINASRLYAGSGELATIGQIVGIISIEATMIGLYLAAYNGKISGAKQQIAAGAAYLGCFMLAALGVVADSWLNAGRELIPTLSLYMSWLLPLAPFFAIAGGLAVHFLAPEKARAMRQLEQERQLAEAHFRAQMASELAKLEESKTIKAMQLKSRQAVLEQLYQVYTGADIQEAIRQTAIQNAPYLLRQAGINVEEPKSESAQSQPKSLRREPVHINGSGPK